ncbi:hypothetical protein [Burkholderia arboris]|uniref:hypothetical protein n=1 Tax=Burkholderia arboris TaxID=488730 RepID=UPI00210A1FC6|nr:hypothetical protein [Burkholderia arboris]UTV59018.1 hypothetical protein NLX30_23070 [Burkholderia arboris]
MDYLDKKLLFATALTKSGSVFSGSVVLFRRPYLIAFVNSNRVAEVYSKKLVKLDLAIFCFMVCLIRNILKKRITIPFGSTLFLVEMGRSILKIETKITTLMDVYTENMRSGLLKR